jgi:iron complex outermembrane receptor protein
LRLNLVATYIDLTYRNYTAPDGTGLSGQPVGEPLWRVAGGFDYLWRDLFRGDVDLTLQDAYTGATRCNADSEAVGQCFHNGYFSVGGAQNRTDGRLAWTSHGRTAYSVAFYVNNLFDKQYATGIQTISESTLGTVFSNITAPRFWGAEVGVHF